MEVKLKKNPRPKIVEEEEDATLKDKLSKKLKVQGNSEKPDEGEQDEPEVVTVEAPLKDGPVDTGSKEPEGIDEPKEDDWRISIAFDFEMTCRLDAIRDLTFEDRNPLIEKIVKNWVDRKWPEVEREHGTIARDSALLRSRQRLLKQRYKDKR
ncbi:MAG: hypothetical protein AAGD43_04955 [Pseudomonadota bacterium]